jgi:hypothetical protein
VNVVADIKDALEQAMKVLQGDLRDELKAQGHYNTGKLHDSIEYEIKVSGSTVVANVVCEDYGLIMEFGVSPGRIPFSGTKRGSGGGGKSKYIEGLITFFENKGLAGKEAVGAAFATAMTHKHEGMPTNGSFRFSKNGERLGFASQTLNRDLELIQKTIENVMGKKVFINVSGLVKMEPVNIYT